MQRTLRDELLFYYFYPEQQDIEVKVNNNKTKSWTGPVNDGDIIEVTYGSLARTRTWRVGHMNPLSLEEADLLDYCKGCCEGRSGPDGHRIKALIALVKEHPEIIATLIKLVP